MSSEPHIIEKIKLKDHKFFEEIFRAHYPELVGFAQKYLEDFDAAEEIVQDLFVKVWENADKLDIKTNFKSYLFGAVRNSCLNIFKHQKIREAYQKAHQDNFSIDAQSHPLEYDELQTEIDGALQKLPEKCREVFMMSRFEEKKYKEIALELNISIKTVENQMGKALKLMRKELAQFLPILLFLMIK